MVVEGQAAPPVMEKEEDEKGMRRMKRLGALQEEPSEICAGNWEK
jgi:hypothetical protein